MICLSPIGSYCYWLFGESKDIIGKTEWEAIQIYTNENTNLHKSIQICTKKTLQEATFLNQIVILISIIDIR